jgi:cytochrome c
MTTTIEWGAIVKRIMWIGLALAALLVDPAGAAEGDVRKGDAAKGKKYFVRCGGCHTLKKGRNRTGPSLHCIVGRPAGTAPRYSYSSSMKALAKTGLKWTEANLFNYLENPREFLKKKLKTDSVHNKMVNRFKRKQFRRDVIAYLKAEACKQP